MSDPRDDETPETESTEPHDVTPDGDATESLEAGPGADHPSDDAVPDDMTAGTSGGDEVEPFEITELSPPPPPPTGAVPVTAADDTGDDTAPTEVGQPPVMPVAPEPPEPPPPAVTPPLVAPFDQAAEPPDGRWPGSAKATAAILAVLALVGIGAAVWFWNDASSAKDDADVTTEQLAAERERADAAEAELAALQEATEGETSEVIAERDAALDERDVAIAERDAARTEQEQTAAELAEAIAAAEALEAQLAEVADAFPIAVSPDLAASDPVGTYATTVREVSCAGLDECGSPPSLDEAIVARDTGGTLRLVIGDQLDVPLTAIDGNLFGLADSQALVAPCGETPRIARVSFSLFADDSAVGLDGALELRALGASIVIDVAEDECGTGFVWYRAQLTRDG